MPASVSWRCKNHQRHWPLSLNSNNGIESVSECPCPAEIHRMPEVKNPRSTRNSRRMHMLSLAKQRARIAIHRALARQSLDLIRQIFMRKRSRAAVLIAGSSFQRLTMAVAYARPRRLNVSFRGTTVPLLGCYLSRRRTFHDSGAHSQILGLIHRCVHDLQIPISQQLSEADCRGHLIPCSFLFA